jgi:hypothetical protein
MASWGSTIRRDSEAVFSGIVPSSMSQVTTEDIDADRLHPQIRDYQVLHFPTKKPSPRSRFPLWQGKAGSFLQGSSVSDIWGDLTALADEDFVL